MIALHDSDYLIYACAFVAQPKDKDLQPVEFAYHALDTALSAVSSKFDSIQYFLTGKGNWRHEIATIKGYKANRVQEKPVYYQQLRDYMVERYKATVCDGEEADDAVGKRQREDTCIVSIDKDLDQITGNHLRPAHKNRPEEFYFVDERTASRKFYTSVLTGDAVDNIQGIYGIGPVNAKKLLAGFSSESGMFRACRFEWNKHYPDGVETDSGRRLGATDACVEVAQLLWISHPGRERWSDPTERSE